jgi:uncharacterized membrane protein (DUF373 family)
MHRLEDGKCSLPDQISNGHERGLLCLLILRYGLGVFRCFSEDDRLLFCYRRELRSRWYNGLGHNGGGVMSRSNLSVLLRNLWVKVRSDESWHHGLKRIEKWVAKILSLLLVVVIGVAVFDLGWVLFQSIVVSRMVLSGKTLFGIFGLFLNVLIALELLENMAGYLQKNVIQVELVIVTAMIAIARKIIILDLDKISDLELVGLAMAMFALAGSYWVMRKVGTDRRHD